MGSCRVFVYIVWGKRSTHRGWGGGTCSGFAAPLNEPYGWLDDGGGVAACCGVLTLWCYAGEREGSALRAVAARLQAEQVPPPRVTFVDARAAEAAAPVRREFAGWAKSAAPLRRGQAFSMSMLTS